MTRHLRKLQNNDADIEENQSEIEEWKRRKEYVIFYPASEKYYSLFPTKEPSEEQIEKYIYKLYKHYIGNKNSSQLHIE